MSKNYNNYYNNGNHEDYSMREKNCADECFNEITKEQLEKRFKEENDFRKAVHEAGMRKEIENDAEKIVLDFLMLTYRNMYSKQTIRYIYLAAKSTVDDKIKFNRKVARAIKNDPINKIVAAAFEAIDIITVISDDRQ